MQEELEESSFFSRCMLRSDDDVPKTEDEWSKFILWLMTRMNSHCAGQLFFLEQYEVLPIYMVKLP